MTMPSAASVKVEEKEKQPAEPSAAEETSPCQPAVPPIKQALVIIEHKIRNLEKRKAKLQSYRDLQSSGRDLHHDQRIAVAKYDEVAQTLDFARDLCKQFQNIAVVADKDAKKTARRDVAMRSQQDLAKIREVLLVQDALNLLGQGVVREDFLHGKNGATIISENDLKLLDELYVQVSPKRELEIPFATQVQTAAEHLLAVIDGKEKEAFGSNYSYIKDIIERVHESGYFDQPENTIQIVTEGLADELSVEPIHEVPPADQPPVQPELPLYPQAEPTMQPEPLVAAPPVVVAPLPQPAPPPLAGYFAAPAQHISEVLSGSSFFFLQESELDSPEQQAALNAPSAIPSQTFTNQNFASLHDVAKGAAPVAVPPPAPVVAPPPAGCGFPSSGGNPPPPIPMPPSHVAAAAALDFAPGMLMGYQPYQPPMPPVQAEPLAQHQHQHQHLGQHQLEAKNGEEARPRRQPPPPQARHLTNGQRRPNQPPGYQPQPQAQVPPQQQPQQNFYQNNNGYQNSASNNSGFRLRNRGGPRLQKTRPNPKPNNNTQH